MTYIIGHRGARAELPENTVPSFVHAQQNGCFAFELDVRLSSDHELMVFHDITTNRTTVYRGNIHQIPSLKLQTLNAKADHLRSTSCFIPTLKQVVDAVPETWDWQFEVKPTSRQRMDILASKLARYLRKNNLKLGRVSVTSSSLYFLNKIHRIDRKIRRGLVADYNGNTALQTAKNLDLELIALNDKFCNQTVVNDALSAGKDISVWTVNDLQRIEQLRLMGVNSVITDIPSTAIANN